MNEAVSPLLEASCLCFQDIALQSLKVTEISFMDYHGYGKAVGEKIKKKKHLTLFLTFGKTINTSITLRIP